MIVLHRLLILCAAASGIGAVLGKFGVLGLRLVATPSAWLRATDTLLFFAIALMLEQLVAMIRAKNKGEPAPAAEQGPEGR